MRVLTIVHQDDAGLGVFAGALEAAGAERHAWMPATERPAPAVPADYGAILSFGGSAHPVQEAEYPWLAVEREFLRRALDAGVPMLGVCLGSQLIAQAAGATAYRLPHAEIGWYEVRLTAAAASDPLFAQFAGGAAEGRFAAPASPPPLEVLHWHSYAVELPPGATALAANETCLQGYRIGDRVWGTQFHAEVTGPDFQAWLDLDGAGADAAQIELDPVAVAAQTDARIGAWNRRGRELCARFLRAATELTG